MSLGPKAKHPRVRQYSDRSYAVNGWEPEAANDLGGKSAGPQAERRRNSGPDPIMAPGAATKGASLISRQRRRVQRDRSIS